MNAIIATNLRPELGPQSAPRRTLPHSEEPAYYASAGLWLFGNVRLLDSKLSHVGPALGPPTHLPRELQAVEQEAERLVLDGAVLVCGFHSPAHQRAAVVPLRWGSPRIVVMSGGFKYHLGDELRDEPFRAARLWRFRWDPTMDLAVSRRAPGRLPTYARHNPSVDRLIRLLSQGAEPFPPTPSDPLSLRGCRA